MHEVKRGVEGGLWATDRALVEVSPVSHDEDGLIGHMADLSVRLVRILVAQLRERELATVVRVEVAQIVQLAVSVLGSRGGALGTLPFRLLRSVAVLDFFGWWLHGL